MGPGGAGGATKSPTHGETPTATSPPHCMWGTSNPITACAWEGGGMGGAPTPETSLRPHKLTLQVGPGMAGLLWAPPLGHTALMAVSPGKEDRGCPCSAGGGRALLGGCPGGGGLRGAGRGCGWESREGYPRWQWSPCPCVPTSCHCPSCPRGPPGPPAKAASFASPEMGRGGGTAAAPRRRQKTRCGAVPSPPPPPASGGYTE